MARMLPQLLWVIIGTLFMSIKETSEGTLEAESRSRTLLGTIKNSWSNIAQKLSDIDHTTGPWTPGTHPFNHFKYKIIRRKITFAAATRNCGRLSGSLLHGDIDIGKYIPELEKETKIWLSYTHIPCKLCKFISPRLKKDLLIFVITSMSVESVSCTHNYH